MARTTEEIYDAFIEEKNTMTELNGLQPTIDDAQTLLQDLSENSKVEDWRIWGWTFAWAQNILEGLWDTFKEEIEEKAKTINYGGLPWYRVVSLEFQFGDDIEWDDDIKEFKYPVVDFTAQIIKRAAAFEITLTQEVVVKVAKEAGEPLSPSELAAFESYIDEISPAGINTSVISQDPDDVRVVLEVFYNPLVMAADGSLLVDPGTFPVENALNNHFLNIEFDGLLIITKLVDDVQLAEGVIDPIMSDVLTRVGAAPFLSVVNQVTAFSGHFIMDTTLPLSSQITYTAYA